mmetsp:Transcript_4620/g.20996  ORF Transcript_4620/g.20996 Transcript_4620/m.20996 type:complete len:496 (+) Transcript_4620:1661-3148(+)
MAELKRSTELVFLVRRPVTHQTGTRVAAAYHEAAVADVRAAKQAVPLVDGGDARGRAPLHALLQHPGVSRLEQVLRPVLFELVLLALAQHLRLTREDLRGEAHETPAELPGVDALPTPHVHAVSHAKGDHVPLAVDFRRLEKVGILAAVAPLSLHHRPYTLLGLVHVRHGGARRGDGQVHHRQAISRLTVGPEPGAHVLSHELRERPVLAAAVALAEPLAAVEVRHRTGLLARHPHVLQQPPVANLGHLRYEPHLHLAQPTGVHVAGHPERQRGAPLEPGRVALDVLQRYGRRHALVADEGDLDAPRGSRAANRRGGHLHAVVPYRAEIDRREGRVAVVISRRRRRTGGDGPRDHAQVHLDEAHVVVGGVRETLVRRPPVKVRLRGRGLRPALSRRRENPTRRRGGPEISQRRESIGGGFRRACKRVGQRPRRQARRPQHLGWWYLIPRTDQRISPSPSRGFWLKRGPETLPLEQGMRAWYGAGLEGDGGSSGSC